MGYGIGHRTYHTAVVRGPITQSINGWTSMMDDECRLAFDDLIRCSNGEISFWIRTQHGSLLKFEIEYEPVALYDTIAMTVARVANRIYVGTEFCMPTRPPPCAPIDALV